MVDLDLETFFDRVNRGVLMARVPCKVGNKRVPRPRVAPKSVARFKGEFRALWRQGQGRSFGRSIEDLAPILTAWIAYYRRAEAKSIFEDVDGWIRRRLRCSMWRQCKRPRMQTPRLMQRRLAEERAWASSMNGHGPWWNAGASHMHDAFRAALFRNLGLISLLDRHRRLNYTP